MKRYEYLTGATLLPGSVADDFADLIVEPDDERIVRGVKSGYTKALFNSVVAVKYASEPKLMLDLMTSINRNVSQPDEWRVIDEGQIDLENTLLMIQLELLESAVFCGPDAQPLLSAALGTDSDVLHFGVLNGIKASQDSAFVQMVKSYRDDLDNRAVNADSRSHLLDAAHDALAACSPLQVL